MDLSPVGIRPYKLSVGTCCRPGGDVDLGPFLRRHGKSGPMPSATHRSRSGHARSVQRVVVGGAEQGLELAAAEPYVAAFDDGVGQGVHQMAEDRESLVVDDRDGA